MKKVDLKGLEGKFNGEDLGRLITIKGELGEKPIEASGYVHSYTMRRVRLSHESPEHPVGWTWARAFNRHVTGGDRTYNSSYFDEKIYRDGEGAQTTQPPETDAQD